LDYTKSEARRARAMKTRKRVSRCRRDSDSDEHSESDRDLRNARQAETETLRQQSSLPESNVVPDEITSVIEILDDGDVEDANVQIEYKDLPNVDSKRSVKSSKTQTSKRYFSNLGLLPCC